MDEEGFRRPARRSKPELHILWDIVEDMRWNGSAIRIHGRRPNGRAGTLLRLRVGQGKWRALNVAWLEYLLRKVEREGVLRGTAPISRLVWVLLAGFTLEIALVGMLLVGVGLRLGYTVWPVTRPMGIPWVLLITSVMPIVLGILCGVVAIWQFRTRRRFLRRWSRWELTSEGLVLWPGGERRVLSPSTEDRISSDVAQIGGERVLLHWLSGNPLVRPLVLAMWKRCGATVRAVPSWEWMVLVIIGVLWIVVLAAVAGSDEPGDVIGALVWTLILGGVLFLTLRWQLKNYRDSLSKGREMLERLGW